MVESALYGTAKYDQSYYDRSYNEFTVDAMILGGPTLISPISVGVQCPFYLVFTTVSVPATGIKKHFEIHVDKTSSAFGDLEISPNSLNDTTGWEYWDGAAWQSLTTAGLDPAYYGNNVRYLVSSLTTGSKWWRVREKIRSGA